MDLEFCRPKPLKYTCNENKRSNFPPILDMRETEYVTDEDYAECGNLWVFSPDPLCIQNTVNPFITDLDISLNLAVYSCEFLEMLRH
jgi:hypothetical protein